MSPSMVQTVGLADWVSLPNPHSCRYCGTNPGFDFLLESLPWFKPGERLSVATRWMCQYPWGKNTGVSRGTNRGGKVTCRNSKTARNLADVARRTVRLPRVATPPRVAIVVQPRGVRYNHWVQPRGVRYNHWVQPRAVIRGRRRTRTRCSPVGGRVHA